MDATHTDHLERVCDAAKEALQAEVNELRSQACRLRHESAWLLRRANELEVRAGVLLNVQPQVNEQIRRQATFYGRALQQDFDEANEGLIGGGQFRI